MNQVDEERLQLLEKKVAQLSETVRKLSTDHYNKIESKLTTQKNWQENWGIL